MNHCIISQKNYYEHSHVSLYSHIQKTTIDIFRLRKAIINFYSKKDYLLLHVTFSTI